MIGVDFFCGAGGLTSGLRQAGIDVQIGVDIEGSFRKTYELNNTGSRFLQRDIKELSGRVLKRELGKVSSNNLIFSACAPCQPFASLNRSANRGPRATLLASVGRLVDELRPIAVIVENVPGLARVGGFSTYRRFAQFLSMLGYSIVSDVLDAKNYGVPQTRRRFVLIGLRKGTAALPEPTHGAGYLPFETVRRAIGGYPQILAGETDLRVPNHRAAMLSDLNLLRLRRTPHDGGSRTAWPRNLWLKCHSGNFGGHTDSYGRMKWDEPAPTLTCRCHSLSNGRYGHPEQDRAISLREAAKLQGFADDYVFHGEILGNLAAQIGNAVPVQFGRAVGRHLLHLLDC
jgi:DNA (cytosine-5)-methyltransferase 1